MNNKVYFLYHYVDENEDETYKLLGVFSSKDKVIKAMELYKSKCEFRSYKDNFLIDENYIGKKLWEEGFGFE